MKREPRDIPIIFQPEMVLALLREAAETGTGKSATRRLLYVKRRSSVWKKNARALEGYPAPRLTRDDHIDDYYTLTGWERALVGDRLWVRENLTCLGDGIWHWAADRFPIQLAVGNPDIPKMVAWAHHEERGIVPSIHMPRWASRLTLTIRRKWIHRLHTMTEADCEREGVQYQLRTKSWVVDGADGRPLVEADTALGAFEGLWRSINGDEAWEENPWVVAMVFDVARQNIDAAKRAA